MYAGVHRFAVSKILSHRQGWSARVMPTLGAMYCILLSCYLLVLLVFKKEKKHGTRFTGCLVTLDSSEKLNFFFLVF